MTPKQAEAVLIKQAEDVINRSAVIAAASITLAQSLVKVAAEKDKTKEKTQFDETSANVQQPLQQQPVDNAQGELSPSDVASADQSQAPLPPPVAAPAVTGDGTAMPPQVAGPNAAAGAASPAPADPMAPSPYDMAAQGQMVDQAGMPVQQDPASAMSQTAAQVARDFLGQEVYNAASNGHPQAMDLMARTAAQLGVGVAEAMSRAIPNTFSGNALPADMTAPTIGLDPASAAAMGMQVPQQDMSSMAQGGGVQDPNAAQAPDPTAMMQDPTQQTADQVIPPQPAQEQNGQQSEQGKKPDGTPDKSQDKKKAEEMTPDTKGN